MLFHRLDTRVSLAVRVLGLALVSWSVIGASRHAPSTSGRGLVVLVLFAVCIAAVIPWMRMRDVAEPLTPDVFVLALGGGGLIAASPYSAASAFAFVAIVSAGLRGGVTRGLQTAGLASFALAVGVIIWDGASVGLLAYVLGFAAASLAGANARSVRERADQAELLLARSQRSQEESLRAARLEESARIAREIHDLLAHALAGLTIQLEATTALIENGADAQEVLTRVRRAHELARDGLRETRRAVGALRDGEAVPVPDALRALATAEGAALTIAGDAGRLDGDVGLAVLRVVQESLTNVIKHAPGSEVTIGVEIAGDAADAGVVVVVVENRLAAVPVTAGGLAGSGGGYGIAGMRERAAALGGTLEAGPVAGGWRVVLRVPAGPGTATGPGAVDGDR